jgi:hypothetical protein
VRIDVGDFDEPRRFAKHIGELERLADEWPDPRGLQVCAG